MADMIQPHNAKPAAVWNSGGARYEDISRGIADSIEHCVLRLAPSLVRKFSIWQPGRAGPPESSNAGAHL